MIQAAVLTVSDSSAAGTRVDLSGPAVREHCTQLGWDVIDAKVVPDLVPAIVSILQAWVAHDGINVVVTTGGTGPALRDVTPEATRQVLDREIPGMAELMRAKGLLSTRFSVLSRGVVGTAARTLIVNLPGSPKGAVESLAVIDNLIPHVVALLAGHTDHGEESATLGPNGN